MFDRLIKLFRRRPIPSEPFVDPILGEFHFVRDIGWSRKISLGGGAIDLNLGSDGELPSNQMLNTAIYWIDHWELRWPQLKEFIRTDLKSWPTEEILPDPEKLSIRSIDVLWTLHPEACMIYLELPDDDFRQFHLTFLGEEPTGFAYDD